MQGELKRIREEAIEALAQAQKPGDLAELKRHYLGKKGALTAVLKGLAGMDVESRREIGAFANTLKEELERCFNDREQELLDQESLLEDHLDLSLPSLETERGGLHPVTQMCYDLNDAFRSLNFEIFEEDILSSELFAFDHLNFPPGHPARESMDTYWLAGCHSDDPGQRLCLRPHLTGASVRKLMESGAPARFVYPGRVYRNETTDAGHDRGFFQYEALIVDRDFSFSSGLLLVKTILEKVFGREVDVRMRAGFFPFVEPGFEIDMKCQVCQGKGCRVCKNVGWIEVMPGGTPHPNVLKAAGLDPYEWTGFYIDIGLDRLVMMRYGVDDVRYFTSGDLRFLKQLS